MKSIGVAAGTVEYDETGEGPPVVLLHGLLMDHRLWDRVLPLLPEGFRYLRPVLPLGAHRLPMNPAADLTQPGQVELLADLLDALELESVTLVHNDWGEGLFLTAHGRDQPAELIRDTEALARFAGDVLVLWSPDNRVMPAEHGRRLAGLIPHARYAEIRDAYVLSPLDQPEAVAAEIGHFLTTSSVRP